MGTRADFYTREDNKMTWLGSIAWDGYPSGIEVDVLKSETKEEYEEQVSKFILHRAGTTPKMGWPWPWDDSCTTDYSYVFENGKVMASCFGSPLFDPLDVDAEEEDGKLMGFFPNMKDIKNMATDVNRSGLMIFKR